MDKNIKNEYIDNIKYKLLQFREIDKIIIFGSFIKAKNPNDIDIAIVQNSDDNFLTLSLKYRKVLREISKQIPLDILPLKKNAKGSFMEKINEGEIIYER